MARRGPKPKPSALRLIDGTHRTTRHGSRERALEQAHAARAGFGPLEKPDDLSPQASAIWDRLIAPAGWLDGTQYAGAVAFVLLWDELLEDPKAFTAGKHGQLRAYAAELGLTDERIRPEPARPADPAARFFR